MARNRTISPDFWTWEAVIDCPAMTRLLFIGLWNFADDGGVQPLRPRTIRMQVFPGDDIGNDDVRAMIDELAARKLVHVYEVEGAAYVAINDWEQLQRVGKHTRRRYPPPPSAGTCEEQVTRISEADGGRPQGIPDAIAVEGGDGPSCGLGPPSRRMDDEKENQFTDPAPLSQAA